NRQLDRGSPAGDPLLVVGCWRQGEGAQGHPCARQALLEFTVERLEDRCVIEAGGRKDPLRLGAPVGSDRQECVLGFDAGGACGLRLLPGPPQDGSRPCRVISRHLASSVRRPWRSVAWRASCAPPGG